MRRLQAELFINLWRAKDGSHETSVFDRRDDALEEIGAEYPAMSYAGTIIVPPIGQAARVEDWSEEAHHYAIEATDDWLERERRAYLARLI